MRNNCWIASLLCFFLLISCSNRESVDLLLINAKVYTVDSAFTVTEAIAVKDGHIIATGTSADLQGKYEAKETVDAAGQYVYPGFIDAHAHFVGYAQSLQNVDLAGTESWQAILDKLQEFAKTHPEGWITGRGWDQNDWPVKEFPNNSELNRLFPDRPVLLGRVDGHAAIANEAALTIAGIKPGQLKVSVCS